MRAGNKWDSGKTRAGAPKYLRNYEGQAGGLEDRKVVSKRRDPMERETFFFFEATRARR